MVFFVVLVVLVTGVKQSQFIVVRLSLDIDNIHPTYLFFSMSQTGGMILMPKNDLFRNGINEKCPILPI